jgi:hypothetical protein
MTERQPNPTEHHPVKAANRFVCAAWSGAHAAQCTS